MCQHQALQSDWKLHITTANHVLDLEVQKLCLIQKFKMKVETSKHQSIIVKFVMCSCGRKFSEVHDTWWHAFHYISINFLPQLYNGCAVVLMIMHERGQIPHTGHVWFPIIHSYLTVLLNDSQFI